MRPVRLANVAACHNSLEAPSLPVPGVQRRLPALGPRTRLVREGSRPGRAKMPQAFTGS